MSATVRRLIAFGSPVGVQVVTPVEVHLRAYNVLLAAFDATASRPPSNRCASTSRCSALMLTRRSECGRLGMRAEGRWLQAQVAPSSVGGQSGSAPPRRSQCAARAGSTGAERTSARSALASRATRSLDSRTRSPSS
jgi:hypothetical protein